MVRLGAESSTPTSPARLPLDRILDHPPDLRIPGRNWTKADVTVHLVEGVRIAVKDYSPRSFLARNTIGRYLTAREAGALEHAKGVEGLVEYVGRLGPFAFATLWVDASPLSRAASPPDSFFDRLDAIVQRLHARGIALGDLHHRDVLVASDGTPRVVDLATSIVLGDHPGPLRRALFARFRDQDRVALARMRARHTGRSVDEAVASVGETAAAWHARGRRVKRAWDRLRGRTSAPRP